MHLRPAFLIAVLLASPVALASRTGIFSPGSAGCNGCHSGGTAPTVSLSLSSSEVMPGDTITAFISFTTPNGSTGGFNLTASKGTMSISANNGSGVKVSGSQATHTQPKAEDGNGDVRFNVDWTAPSVTSNTTINFTAYVNSVNGNNFDTGDRGTQTTQSVTVCGNSYFEDLDEDGFGNNASKVVACAAPMGFVAQGGDCDDGNADVHPNATETCNGTDDNCNGKVDDGAGSTWYVDSDDDGFGDSANAKTACTQPMGYVMDGTDCDDSLDSIHPGAAELCDGKDQDCNGLIDDELMGCEFDAGIDPGMDAGFDAGIDAGIHEPGVDAGSDAGAESIADAGPNAGSDGGVGVGDEPAVGCGCDAASTNLAAGALWCALALGYALRRRRTRQ